MPKELHPNSLANLRKPWAKGESGNPKGGHKGPRLTPILDAHLSANDNAKAKKLIERCYQMAMAGDPSMMKLMFERIDGRVPNPVELTGADGGALKIAADADSALERLGGLTRTYAAMQAALSDVDDENGGDDGADAG